MSRNTALQTKNKSRHRLQECLCREGLFYLAFVGVLLLVAFLCFYRLDAKYVDPWDEARHGVNAYEMANGGSLFQNTYLRQADYYNLKPPFSMWGIMLGFALFGKSVFALRFYSALSYLLLVALAGLFVKRYGKLEAILGMLFLAANTTAFMGHMVRAGDADSLYVLFFTIAMLAMMLIQNNVKWVYVCGLFASFGFLTKSFHALMIPAIGFLYLLLTGLIKKMKWKEWLVFLFLFLFPVIVWAMLRMRVDGTTFFVKMWETDVCGRTSGALKNNIAPFSYYFSFFFGAMSQKTTVYLCALIILLIGLFRYPHLFSLKKRAKWLGFFLWMFIPFLGFSLVTNKLVWYVYPALIPLLLTAGIIAAKLIKDQNLFFTLRLLCLGATAWILVWFVQGEVSLIQKQQSNEIQTLLFQAAEKTKVTGCEAYVEYRQEDCIFEPTAWCQQDVFVCEISGDYRCINGGYKQLQKTKEEKKKPVILLAKKGVDVPLKPVASSENYVMYFDP